MSYEYVKKIDTTAYHDVIVCGGGFSGFAAAYASAREGADVLLIERGFCLGGVGTQSLVNHLLGAREFDLSGGTYNTCIGDVFDLIEDRILEMGGGVDVDNIDLDLPPHGWYGGLGVGLIFDKEKMKLLLEQMLSEVGVHILYGTDIVDVIREGDRLSGVIVHNKSGLSVITGRAFIDATGDADVCALAGCDFAKGDEEGEMAAASLEMHVENVEHEKLMAYMRKTRDVRFRALIEPLKKSGEWTFPYDIFISVMLTKPDVFMINTIRQIGVDGTDAESVTRAVLHGRKENFALLQVMRRHFPGFENATIREIAPTVGIRETRRIVGEYTLTVPALVEALDFEDSIALSAYGWDMPNPKNPSYQPFHGVKRKSPYTQIPYRCLVPRGMDNLINIGRSVSAEREVLGPLRVMAPCIAMGVAAGIASHAVCEENIRYQDVNVQALREKIVFYGGFVDRAQVKMRK